MMEERQGPEPRVRLIELTVCKTRTLLRLSIVLFPLEDVYEKLWLYANLEGMLIEQIDLTARVHRTYMNLRFYD